MATCLLCKKDTGDMSLSRHLSTWCDVHDNEESQTLDVAIDGGEVYEIGEDEFVIVRSRWDSFDDRMEYKLEKCSLVEITEKANKEAEAALERILVLKGLVTSLGQGGYYTAIVPGQTESKIVTLFEAGGYILVKRQDFVDIANQLHKEN